MNTLFVPLRFSFSCFFGVGSDTKNSAYDLIIEYFL